MQNIKFEAGQKKNEIGFRADAKTIETKISFKKKFMSIVAAAAIMHSVMGKRMLVGNANKSTGYT